MSVRLSRLPAVHVDLTLRGPAGERDVAVVAGEPVPLSAVRARLLRAAGWPAGTVLWAGRRRLGDEDRIGVDVLSGAVLTTARGPEEGDASEWQLQVVGGPRTGTVRRLGREVLVVGRAARCGLVLDDDRVSREHLAVERTVTGAVVTDLGSTNGSTVDGVPLTERAVVTPGQLLRVGDSLLAIRRAGTEPAPVSRVSGAVAVRTGRRPPQPDPRTVVERPEPIQAPPPARVPWLAALLPAAAGVGIAWFTHSPMFLLFALLAPLTLAAGTLGDRLHRRRGARRAAAAHRDALARARRQVATALAAETADRRDAAPDLLVLAAAARCPGVRLWERGGGGAVSVRVGSGDVPSSARVRTGEHAGPAGVVHEVPLTVDLRAGPVGVAGPPAVTRGLARAMLLQLCVLHPPSDVAVRLAVDDGLAPVWRWARWLPHLGALAGGEDADRWTVTLVDTASPAAVAASARGSAIVLAPRASLLPAACATVVQVLDAGRSRVSIRRGGVEVAGTADAVPPAWAEAVARDLGPLVDAGRPATASLPLRCSLLDLLGLPVPTPAGIRRVWAVDHGRADTVLGVAASGPLALDLDGAGPHALIAGTTGSGKSELLRALVAGLALRHPPDALTVLLVDYKGGAAFGDCARLPHCVGLVTDLDPFLTRRALRSLDAELRRRERVLAAAGVDSWQRLPAGCAGRLPRLVIVVDEFATLADELPDFVSGLVGIARRGRSLGVHLVLATQRPGAAVSAEIRANTGLRIALRVTDAAESRDVIDDDTAARLPRDVPGRAVAVIDGRRVLFQTASPSIPGRPPDAVDVVPLGEWRRPPDPVDEPDSLARLVDAVAAAAAHRTADRAADRTAGPGRPLWTPPLPAVLELAGEPHRVGTVDLPSVPAQPSLCFDVGVPHSWLLVGSGRSGRTTALAAAVLVATRDRSPDALEVHVIDADGALARVLGGLPHVATCLGPPDVALTGRLADLLAATPPPPSRVRLLVLDGWHRIATASDQPALSRGAERVTALLGAADRPAALVAGDRSLLSPRIAGAFDERFALPLADRGDYPLLGVRADRVPHDPPPGRAVRAGDGAEVQFGVPAGWVAARDPGTAFSAVAAAVAQRWAGVVAPGAVRVRALPARVQLDSLPAREVLRVGVGGDAGELVTLDPWHGGGRWLVSGPPRSGRTTLLRTLLAEAVRRAVPVAVAAPDGSPLHVAAARSGVPRVGPGDLALPHARGLLLIDDAPAFDDSPLGTLVGAALDGPDRALRVVLAASSEEVATAYRGPIAAVRRARCGIVLRPGPVDGDLLGVGVGRHHEPGPPGRGLLVGDAAWSHGRDGRPVPVQAALS